MRCDHWETTKTTQNDASIDRWRRRTHRTTSHHRWSVRRRQPPASTPRPSSLIWLWWLESNFFYVVRRTLSLVSLLLFIIIIIIVVHRFWICLALRRCRRRQLCRRPRHPISLRRTNRRTNNFWSRFVVLLKIRVFGRRSVYLGDNCVFRLQQLELVLFETPSNFSRYDDDRRLWTTRDVFRHTALSRPSCVTFSFNCTQKIGCTPEIKIIIIIPIIIRRSRETRRPLCFRFSVFPTLHAIVSNKKIEIAIWLNVDSLANRVITASMFFASSSTVVNWQMETWTFDNENHEK